MLLSNKTQTSEPFPTSTAAITSLSLQQGSQWGPGGIGTVVFGCVASVLGILALWMMFWVRQREPGHAIRSDGEVRSRHYLNVATASDDDVALGYLPRGGDTHPDAIEGYPGEAGVNTEV